MSNGEAEPDWNLLREPAWMASARKALEERGIATMGYALHRDGLELSVWDIAGRCDAKLSEKDQWLVVAYFIHPGALGGLKFWGARLVPWQPKLDRMNAWSASC